MAKQVRREKSRNMEVLTSWKHRRNNWERDRGLVHSHHNWREDPESDGS